MPTRIRRWVGRLGRASVTRLDDARWQLSAGISRRRSGASRAGCVAFNMRPPRGPWGGGSQWVVQMADFLIRHGYDVRFDLDGQVDCIVLVEPRQFSTTTFGVSDIRRYRDHHPDVVCLHRVNEGGAHKSSQEIDDILREANEVADTTVFISEWIQDYHAARWFDRTRPHAVIYNGADTAIFHPVRRSPRDPNVLRIVTHHWSANWRKGYAAYQELDGLIADGTLPGAELWVIGRWPEEIRWRSARTFGPATDARLAALLRRCDLYITASVWEAGGMHHVEGAQCGLPVVYHEDGGGIVEAASQYGVGFRQDLLGGMNEARDRFPELRGKVLRSPPSGDRMCFDYFQMIQRLIAQRLSHASAL